jgi:hypothetical protein
MELLNDVQLDLFSELTSKKPIDEYRRLLQKSYVAKLSAIIAPSAAPSTISIQGLTLTIGTDLKRSDVPAIVRAQLVSLRSKIAAATPTTTDTMSKIHLLDLDQAIKKALDPK